MQNTGTGQSSGDSFNSAQWNQDFTSIQNQVSQSAEKLQKAKTTGEIFDVTEGSRSSPNGGLTSLINKIGEKIRSLDATSPEIAKYSVTSSPKNPVEKIKKAFSQLKTYAAGLQEQAEVKLKTSIHTVTASSVHQMKEKVASATTVQPGVQEAAKKQDEISSAPVPSTMTDVFAVLKKRCGNPESLDKLFGRHLGSEERNYSMHDIGTLMEWEGDIKTKIAAGGDGVEELKKALQLIDEIKTSIKTAFKERIALINATDLNKLATPRQIPGGDLDCVTGCHDFYWDFHNPLTAQISISNFAEMYQYWEFAEPLQEFFKDIPRNIPAEKLSSLSQAAIDAIAKRATNYEGLDAQNLPKAHAHKLQYLKAKMEASSKQWKQTPDGPPKVLILGGGPGGLMRLLAAGIEGVDVKLFEKRSNYERPMVVMLQQKLLSYFGVIDKLLQKKQIYPGEEIRVQIMHLENALVKTVEDLMGKQVMLQGEPKDIRQGPDQNGTAYKLKTYCFIQEPGQNNVKPYAADLIVDSTGAGAAAAKILGESPSEQITKPVGMVVVVLDNNKTKPQAQDEANVKKLNQITDKDFNYTILPTPNVTYLQIQPTGDLHTKFLDLLDKSDKLKRQLEGLKNQPQTALTLQLKNEKEAVDNELAALSKQFGDAAAKKHGGKVAQLQVQKVSSFKVQIAKRKPAVAVGDAMVMQSGDSLVMPDPKSGKGANTAISGTVLFAKTLQDYRTGSTADSREAGFRNFNFASEKLADAVVSFSAEKRGGEIFETFNFALHELGKLPDRISPEQIKSLRILSERKNLGQPYTEADRKALEDILETCGFDEDYGPLSRYENTLWYKTFKNEVKAMQEYAKTS